MELPGTGTRDTVGLMHDESKQVTAANETRRQNPTEIFLVVVIARMTPNVES